MIALAVSGDLFRDPAFENVPPHLRRINDIAFSGDGEPTTCKFFKEAVALAAELKRAGNLDSVKIILITDACYLTRPDVRAGLAMLDQNNGEIWAKLDAGTEEYYQLVNRPNYPLTHVIANIIDAARVRPVVIQSLFMRLHGLGPTESEIAAYVDRLSEILQAGGKIKLVQVYTVARKPAEGFVAALSPAEVDVITQAVRRRTGLYAESYYGGS